MADVVRTFLSTAKKYIESPAYGADKEIDEVFFPNLDESIQTTVTMDRFLGGPAAAASIVNGQAANVVKYTPGNGQVYEVQLTKEKTPVDEALRDSVIAGIDAEALEPVHYQKLTEQIVGGPKGFRARNKVTRVKAAMDVLRTGIMTWYSEAGAPIATIDFSRDANISPGSLTFDMSLVKFDEAMKSTYDLLRAKHLGFPNGGIGVLVGDDWLNNFESDSAVQAKRAASSYMNLIREDLLPPTFENCSSMHLIATYNNDGISMPINIFTHTPTYQYKANDAATPAPYLPVDAFIMFPMDMRASNYRVNRGVDVKASDNAIMRTVGDMVLDTFTGDDPPVQWFRSNARFGYMAGNINTIASGVGTNL